MIYALDSNIISYMLKDNAAVYARIDKAMDAGGRCIIPPVVYYEVKRGLLAVNATSKERDFEQLCREFGVGRMNSRAWSEAARLYVLHRQWNIEDADLFIAAFCIVEGYTLVTNNTKHFINIDRLNIVDWTQ